VEEDAVEVETSFWLGVVLGEEIGED